MKAFSSSKRYRLLLACSALAVFSHLLLLVMGPATDGSSFMSILLTGSTALWCGTLYSVVVLFHTRYFTVYSDYCSQLLVSPTNGSSVQPVVPPDPEDEERCRFNSWLFICIGAVFALEIDLLWIIVKFFNTVWTLWKFEQNGTLTTAFSSTITLAVSSLFGAACVGWVAIIVTAPLIHIVSIGERAGFWPLKLVDRSSHSSGEPKPSTGRTEVSILDPD